MIKVDSFTVPGIEGIFALFAGIRRGGIQYKRKPWAYTKVQYGFPEVHYITLLCVAHLA